MLYGFDFCEGQSLLIKQGMRISKSSQFKKANYRIIAPADTSRGVIVIEGNNIVVDFNGVELRGDATAKRPDEFAGIAIYIRNSKNVTIRNLKARGYKIALLARNAEKLTIENCDFSYNYRPHLNSTQEKEDISDWMSYHHNEKDEWMRYGAAMYLRDCDQLTIRNCKVTGGQNALMMTGCDRGKIYNNNFSYNSGIGVGMYRCNSNEIAFNRINFNVRGYSHGVYNRGQDSAGILVYEQSNYNIFYKNSATHSGDGFFLWAGQTTMDTGEGGCNSNEILDNDFSYAPTNGVEVTFSRVRVSGNRIFECDHGIWGGYSYSSKFSDNHFRNNRIGIAIEHGQYNEITDNIFVGDREAIKLWSRKQQPSDWGYAKYRDTRSVGYTIATNSFNSNPIVYNITATDSLQIFSNRYAGYGAIFKVDSSVTNLDSLEVDMADTTMVLPQVKNPVDPFKGNGKFAGRKNIMITEWGPYDFQYPIIWNTNPTDKSDTMKFDLIGPAGEWQVKRVKGVKDLSEQKGKFPATITAIKLPGERTDISIELDYKGAAITNTYGEKITARKAFKFSFRKFFQPVDWEVNFYLLDTTQHNPVRTGTLFSMTEKKAPFRTERKDRLDYAWWGGIKEAGIQHPQFITMASGSADLKPGKYELGLTWDDAVRLYVDDKLVIDEWNPSKYSFDESPHKKVVLNLGGKHSFRVEHLELGGFATLSLKIKPVE
jgi:parallel beta-helix repeat protein